MAVVAFGLSRRAKVGFVKRSWRWTAKKVDKRIRDGYGQGQLASYIPWLGVRDLSSIGTSTRMWSPKTGRMMEFLSNIERDGFLIAEFREDFVDYWENWPLDRKVTLWAAAALGYRHPIYLGSTIPVVMTIDAVLTLRGERSAVRRLAIDYKSSEGLENPRTIQKLAIVRTAAEKTGLPHLLVTEQALRKQLVHNILWVRMALPKSGEKLPTAGAFDIWPMRLHKELLKGQNEEFQQGASVADFSRQFEQVAGLPSGLGLRCMKLLIWEHLVELNMELAHPERTAIGDLIVKSASAFTLPLKPLSMAERTTPMAGQPG